MAAAGGLFSLAERTRFADGEVVERHEQEDEEEEEEERVVYYDLDDAARPPLPSTARPAKRDIARRPPSQRVLAQPKQLFASHAALAVDGGADEEDEAEDGANPFAALLQAKPVANAAIRTTTRSPPVAASRRGRAKTLVSPPSPPVSVSSTSPPSPAFPIASSSSSSQASTLASQRTRPRATRSLSPVLTAREQRKRTPPLSRLSVGGSKRATVTTTTRPLVPTIEAADARPARWARNAPASGTTKRRQSTASTTRQRVENKRRKSMPSSVSSLDGSHGRPSAHVGRRLSDVLSRATTLLSQERTPTASSSGDNSFEYADPTRETDDGIADTANEMRDEPFQTQFFSPSKLRKGGGVGSRRRSNADTVLTKIRGGLGEAIRKATRKTNRDLTLLRSQGQTLLGRADQDSASDIHRRDYVVVQLDRLVAHPHLTIYDGVIQDLRISLEDDNGYQQGVQPTQGLRLTIVFSGVDATQQLTQGARLKIYVPFQIVNEWSVPGVRRRRKKFLIGTSLFEVVS